MLCTAADILGHCWERTVEQRVAIVDGLRRITYRELLAQALEHNFSLRAAGLKKGDRVAIYLSRSVEAVASLFGTFFAGGVAVIVNDFLRPRQVKYIVEHSEASFLITDGRHLSAVPDDAVAGRCIVNVDERAPSHPECTQAAIIGNDLAVILYTSGSTGLPKGVMVRHENLLEGAEIVSEYLKLSQDDVVISLLPFSFDYGLNQVLAALLVGATLVIQRSVIPPDICRTLEREKVTGMALVPMLWLQLIDRRSPFPQSAFPNLRYITNSGGRVPEPAVRLVRKTHPHVSIYLMYGLTEAFRSTYLPPDHVDQRPTSIGKAIPNVEILIVNEQGGLCGVDEPGELVHRGALITCGYWRDPASTARVFRQHPLKDPGREGLEITVFSGDLARMDADGYLYFAGRRDQLLKSRGFRVSPEEVEQWVFESAMVSGVVAFGAGGTEAEAEIVLAVVPKDPETFREDMLWEFCKRELPAYMKPRAIWRLEEIPLTSSGKPDRVALQRSYDEQCARS
jgi:acyl-CoA ligase (AMP-forming) (exosortase A-associated)